MRNIRHDSLLTRSLVKKGIFHNDPLQVVDIGMCSLPVGPWTQYESQIFVHGFQANTETADTLNTQSNQCHTPFHCHTATLGHDNYLGRLFTPHHNLAASSLFSITAPHTITRDVDVWRFDGVAEHLALAQVDFVKIDVNGAELHVLEGMGKYLEADLVKGFEIGVGFVPEDNKPLFSEVELLLRRFGYRLYNMDINRSSHENLHFPVAWDHRDHDGNPIFGPTIGGPVTHGTALFFKNTDTALFRRIYNTAPPAEVLKVISLMDVFGLADCAAKLLLEYKKIIQPLVIVDDLLDALVPDYFGKGLSYDEYREAYLRHTGRPPVRKWPRLLSKKAAS